VRIVMEFKLLTCCVPTTIYCASVGCSAYIKGELNKSSKEVKTRAIETQGWAFRNGKLFCRVCSNNKGRK